MNGIDFDKLKANKDWPFKKLIVGEMCSLQGSELKGKTTKQAQNQCHAYGHLTNKKFSTLTVDGVLYVKRIK